MGFTGGEISPWLSTRYDLQAYQRGAAGLTNFLTMPYGGLRRRRGSELVRLYTDESAIKLFPFCYSESDALMLEFFPGGMRVYESGVPVTYDGEVYVLETPWTAASLIPSLRFTQINDVVYVTNPYYPPMTLRRIRNNWWVCSEMVLEPYPRESYSLQHDLLHVEMSADGESATLTLPTGSSMAFTAAMAGHEYVLADAPVATQTLFEDTSFDCGKLVDMSQFYEYTIPVGTCGYVKNTVSGFYRYYTCIREFHVSDFNGSKNPDDYPYYFLPGFMWLNDDGQPYEVAQDWELRTKGDWNAEWELWRSYDTQEQGSHYALWQWTRLKTFSQGNSTERQNWALSGSELYPCRMVIVCRGSTSLPIDNVLYFRALGGKREYKFKITDVQSATVATASVEKSYLGGNKNFATKSWSYGAMGARLYYPQFSLYHQGRLWFGGIPGLPTSLIASAVDDFHSFHVGSNDDDALHLTMASDNQSKITWVCPTRELLIGTTDSEWLLGSSSGGAITATNASFRRQSSVGSADIPPLAVENTLLFVQRGQKRVREISYKLESDGFTATDVSLLAEHLFRSGVRSWCVQRGADFYVWVLMNDGSAAVLTLNLEQDVTAWQRVRFSGRSIVQVAAIPGSSGAEDEVWLVLRNESTQALSLERIRESSVFADGYLTVKVTQAGQLSGLGHLAGCQVRATLSGGWNGSAATVGKVSADGVLPLSHAVVGRYYHVACPYESAVETLPLEHQASYNSVREMSRVRVRLLESALDFEYKATHAQRWEATDPAVWHLSAPYSGSVRLTQMPEAHVGQGLQIRYSGTCDFKLLSLTVEVDYHGK